MLFDAFMGLREELRHMGVASGDVVMVHASMRAVGGRAENVVSALLHALGPEGTLMAYVDFEPTESPGGGLEFDIERSPACRGHGVLAEVVRRWRGAVRSTNPGASMVALGARAEWLCRDHPLIYGYGPGSPLAKLVEVRGKVLLLGSHFDHVTVLHYAEHLARLPEKRVVRYTVRCGGVDLAIEEFDTSEGVVASMPDTYFDRVVRAFVSAGQSTTGVVGGSVSHVLPAASFVAFAVRMMERDLR